MLCAILKECGMTPIQIAFEIGRNRSTIERAIHTHVGEMQYDGRYTEEYSEVMNMLSSVHKKSTIVCKYRGAALQ